MKQKTQRWLLCVVVVLAMVAAFALAACNNTTYKATFVGGDGASAAIEGKANEEITLPQNTFQRANHTFAGWNDGTKTYNAGAKYTLTNDVTFTAQWTENESDAPFATAAFDGVLLKFESMQNGVQFVFTSISSGNGRHTMRINTPQDSLVGSYTISEEGNIVIYKNDDAIGEGNIDGKTLTVSAKVGDEQTEVSATGDMYKVTISANTQTNDMIVFVNAGAPLFPLLSLLPFGTTDATIEFNGEPFDVEAEEDALVAGTGYTTMPAQDSTVEITIPTPTGPTLHFALGDHAAAGAVAPKDLVVYGYGNTILHDAVEAEEGWVFAGWEQYNQGEATGRIYSAGSAFANSFVFEDVYFVAHYERANAISMGEVYVYFMDDDGNMLSIMEYFAVFATADEEVALYFDYSEAEEGYTVIDCDDPSATDLQLYTTETTLEFRLTYDGQNYEYSIPLYKLTLRGEEEGEWLEFLTIYANEGSYIGDLLVGQGIVSFTYEGQSYEGEDLEYFEMPAKDIVLDVAFEEFDDVDLSQYEGTYVASFPFVIGGYSLNRIVITAAGITAYTTDGDQLGLSYTVTGNDPDELLTDSLGEPFYLSFYSGGISVYTDGYDKSGDFSLQEGEELTLDEYAGEWEFDPQSVEMGPKEFDGFKVEDGKIYFHSNGSYGDALTPSLSEEGGKVVATVQATQTWEATITFESATSASLEATDSFDNVSATCTKKGSAPAKKTLADYEGTWEGKDASDIGVTSFRIGTDKVEYELDAGPGEYTEFTSYEVDDSGENLVVTCHKTGSKIWDMIITFTSDNKATVEIKSQTSEFTKAGTETDPFAQLIGVWTHDQEQIVISEAGKGTQTDSGSAALGSIIIGGEFVYLIDYEGAIVGVRADYNIQIAITYADGQVTVSSTVWGDGEEPVVTNVVYGQKQNLNNATLSSFEGVWKITGQDMTFTIGDNITCSNENVKVDGYHIVDRYLIILFTQAYSKYQYVLSRNGDTLSGYYTAPEKPPQTKTFEKQQGTVGGGGSSEQPPVTTGKTFVGNSTKSFSAFPLGNTTIVITEITIDTTQIVKTCKIVGTADGKAFDLEVTLENSDLKWYEGEKPAKYFYGFEIKPGTVACAYNLAVLEDGSLLLCGDNGVPLSDGAFTAQ